LQDVRVVVTRAAGVSLMTVSVRLIQPPAGITAQPFVVLREGDWTVGVATDTAVPPATYALRVEAVSQGLNLLPVTRTRTLTLHVTR
jgi:hypothetical protein